MTDRIHQFLLAVYLLIAFSFIGVPNATAQTVELVEVSGQIEIWAKGEKGTLSKFDNAVVYLEGVTTPPPEESEIVDQRKKKFRPRVLPIVEGQKVKFYNQDSVSHNVFSTDKNNNFDLGRYPKGEFKEVQYNKRGMFKVYCNIHQSMILDILVLGNQYFATTDTKGNFKISNVPDGKYELNVWHIYGGEFSQPIEIKNSSLILPKIKIVNSKFVKDVVKHKNKDGKSYKKRRGRRGNY